MKSGRSRTLGCVGPKGGARVLDGLPGALLSWVCGRGVWYLCFCLPLVEVWGAQTEERFSGVGGTGGGEIVSLSA